MSEMKKTLRKVKVVPPEVLTIIGAYETYREGFIAMYNPTNQLMAFRISQSEGIVVKPRYGYIRCKGETLIKVHAAALDKGEEPSDEEIKVYLAAAPKQLPQSPRRVWAKGNEPHEVKRRKLKVICKLPDATSASNDDSVRSDSNKSGKSDRSDKSKEKSDKSKPKEKIGQKKSSKKEEAPKK